MPLRIHRRGKLWGSKASRSGARLLHGRRSYVAARVDSFIAFAALLPRHALGVCVARNDRETEAAPMTAKKRRAIKLKAEQVQRIEAYCKARGISTRRFLEDRIDEAISDLETTN